MDEVLVNQLAQFAWEAFRATKPPGVGSPADLTAAAESVLRLFGGDPIDASLDGLGEMEIAALRICIELDSADAMQKNDAVITLAQAFEPFIKRLLARVDEAAFDRYRRSSRSFDLKKGLAHLGLGLSGNIGPDEIDRHESPQREIDWAYVARNECAHGAPKWSRADRERRCEALVAAMLLAAHQHNRSLTTAHAAVDWGDLTHRILDQSAIDEVRSRFVTLIAGEQTLSPIEPTASEMAWVDPFDMGSTAIADDEDADADDDSDDESEPDGPLFEQRRGKVAQLILDIGRFLLVGRPGAGKTTSLRMVEWQLAKDLAEGTQPLAPVLVELKRCRPSAGAGVLALAAKRMGVEDADQILADGEIVLLLDGVNEVAESEFDAVQIEIDEILCAYPSLPIVITSRPGWHRNQAQLPVFALDPLDDARIAEFLQKNMRPEIVPMFLADLSSFPKLWTLARNPLTLAMLARVGEESGGVVPENRAIVLRLFFDWMADREARKGLQVDRHIKCILLSRLAWTMRTDGVMTLSTEQALRITAAARMELGLGVSVDEFLDEVTDNGFIQHVGDEVSFEHELFLEYFAATELARRAEGEPEIATRLSEDPRWREPVLLAYGLAAPSSAVRAQICAGRASVAADALMEQRDTTREQRAEMARSISQRENDTRCDIDVLLGLMNLEDGDALFTWLCTDRDRLKLIGRIDTSSADLATLIRAVFATCAAEARLAPDPGALRDSKGRVIRYTRRPSHMMRTLLRSHPGQVPNEQQASIEQFAIDANIPGNLKWRMLAELAAFMPVLFLRNEVLVPRSKGMPYTARRGDQVSLAELTRSVLLEGRLWRALAACVDLVTGEARGSALDLVGLPCTAGRDWMQLIRLGAVNEKDTLNLIAWVERCLARHLTDTVILKELRPEQSPKRVMFSDKQPFIFARCTAVLLSLLPKGPVPADLDVTSELRSLIQHKGRSPKKLCSAACGYLRSLTPSTDADGATLHTAVRRLLGFVKTHVPAIITTAEVAPLGGHDRLRPERAGILLRIPANKSEAEAIDHAYAGHRFLFTVIPAKSHVQYRFLRFDGSGSQTAYYSPPRDATHGTLDGGQRVTAEIRSTWIKKRDCWGIKAIDVRLDK